MSYDKWISNYYNNHYKVTTEYWTKQSLCQNTIIQYNKLFLNHFEVLKPKACKLLVFIYSTKFRGFLLSMYFI